MGEARFYKSLHAKNKGIFYRGASRAGAGGGSDLGALGRGLYLTWNKNVAQFFADRSGGQVYAYELLANLKLLDAQSREMVAIKAAMGFQPWEYSDDPMYAASITAEVKDLGYDGVISDNRAEGLVLFDPSMATLVQKATKNPEPSLITFPLYQSGWTMQQVFDAGGYVEDGWAHVPYEAVFPVGSTLDRRRKPRKNPKRDRRKKAEVLYFVGKSPAFPVSDRKGGGAWERAGRKKARTAVFLSDDPLSVGLKHGARGHVYAYEVPWSVIKESGGIKRYDRARELMVPGHLWPKVRFLGKAMGKTAFHAEVRNALRYRDRVQSELDWDKPQRRREMRQRGWSPYTGEDIPRPRRRKSRKNPRGPLIYTLLWEHRRGKRGERLGLPGAEDMVFRRRRENYRWEPLKDVKARVGRNMILLRRYGVPLEKMMVLDRQGNDVPLQQFLDAYRESDGRRR